MKKLIVFVLALVCVLGLIGHSSESSSVGFIGGADGPTAMVVTSHINWLYVCGFIGITAVAVLVSFFICRNKKNK